MQPTLLKLFIDDKCGGVPAVAKETGLSVRAIYKWAKKGSLPRTEFTSETNYSQNLSDLSKISTDEIKNRFKPQPQQQPEPEEA